MLTITEPGTLESTVTVTVAITAIFVLVGLATFERFRRAIGSTAEPLVSAHNAATDAHPEIHEAIALLQQTQSDLQRQVAVLDSHRRENFETLQNQLGVAIALLRNE